ncbi:UNVERIFIED_CONTAM: hypothetical protein PYX00_003001 [Menopon gallinae]|uniref:Uncharacterized protein n=1 Tax=Menopon gallinae TaxID=328185 RepID=A0AAW2HZZ6_9NEOP
MVKTPIDIVAADFADGYRLNDPIPDVGAGQGEKGDSGSWESSLGRECDLQEDAPSCEFVVIEDAAFEVPGRLTVGKRQGHPSNNGCGSERRERTCLNYGGSERTHQTEILKARTGRPVEQWTSPTDSAEEWCEPERRKGKKKE